MITWTLIVFLAWGDVALQPLNIPGFTTVNACTEAATMAKAAAAKAYGSGLSFGAVCLPSRSE